ncbi:MAG TPA: L-seryl-tRNA(Sec) selenium transferase [Candidatus Limnocylindrales bacterium]|nr:L-seryl-tRNA(Sec) selenium transferase [Candidatus Limnocylindrales bacterium]
MSRPRSPRSPRANDALRGLPSVESLLSYPALQALGATAPRAVVVGAVRAAVARARDRIRGGKTAGAPSAEALTAEAAREVEASMRASLRPVLNATGVILHTNLGRAPLAEEAALAAAEAGRRYINLELDLESGARGSRMAHLEPLLRELLGAPAALVVNNNAAAMLLALNTLARGKEAVVSRGQLVEIGGSFRIHEILERAGAVLREVGTTNKTRLADYERVIGPATGAILRVHPSNFAIVGFAADVPREELVRLARKKRVPLVEDVGSGALVDLRPYGLPEEPLLAEALAQGVPLACASGDKLLGGPQAGILAGTKALIAACRANPMTRALRVDKMTLAALEVTLRIYRDPERREAAIPVLRMLGEPATAVLARARRALRALGAERATKTGAEVIRCTCEVGGGAMPLARVPSFALALQAPRGRAEALARALRLAPDPVLGRIEAGRLLLDMRTVSGRDIPRLVAAVARVIDEEG